MKRSMTISVALFLTVAGFACTPRNKDNNGMDRTQPQPQTDTTVPNTTNPSTVNPTSANPSPDMGTAPLTNPAGTTNCPDPMAPGYDPTKADPACPRPGTDIPPPATPTDPTRPTPP